MWNVFSSNESILIRQFFCSRKGGDIIHQRKPPNDAQESEVPLVGNVLWMRSSRGRQPHIDLYLSRKNINEIVRQILI